MIIINTTSKEEAHKLEDKMKQLVSEQTGGSGPDSIKVVHLTPNNTPNNAPINKKQESNTEEATKNSDNVESSETISNSNNNANYNINKENDDVFTKISTEHSTLALKDTSNNHNVESSTDSGKDSEC